MKLILKALLFLAIPCFAAADEVSHREAAAKLLETLNGPATMRAGFMATAEPMIEQMKRQGMPGAAADEMKAAIMQWFDEEIKWDELKPKMIDLYKREFSEPELKETLAFYQTPTGKKTLSKLPLIMQEGAVIGQQYAATKQQSLNQRIQQIIDKYRPKEGAAESGSPPNAPTSAP